MTHSRMIALIGGLTIALTTVTLQAGPINTSRHAHSKNVAVVHEAEQSVDQAWDVYHRAALGGTIASPALQAQIEQHLHAARTLVTRAQGAADRGDRDRVKRLVGEIRSHTVQAIQGSKEKKK